jgi:hypothetical protein
LSLNTPPLWFSYIPLGWLLALIYDFFSWHGLVEITISFILVGLGNQLLNLNGQKHTGR